MKARILTRTILLVSFVSLFTDVASEMLYPVMPVYLRSIGFSVLLIGILEGVAEAVAGLSKGYFGQSSDTLQKRLPFVRGGYTLSAFSKPMMAVLTWPWWIFLARTMDRLGKGIRTGARDAILSDETTPEHKGKVFGFHRSMDTVGAAIGPILALIYLWFYPGEYKMLFILAFFPGLIAIGLTFFLKEKKTEVKTSLARPGFLSYLKYWKRSAVSYRYLVAGLLLFTLFNSSDAFLLLAIKDKQVSDTGMISMYIFYNLVYALASYPLGILADRIGLKTMLIYGLFLFAGVYLSFGFTASVAGFLVLFFFYGVYAASTEGISKALISNIAAKQDTATAIGFYTSFASVFSLLASSIAGVLWFTLGMKPMFMISGAGVLVAGIYFLLILKKIK
ncbi:MAG: MFS transporter [Bacteroidetes bacterium]|nr:MFS transporter [Bacteroidota bacterium]